MSRVLNGKPGVSESTRQAVLTALDVLGYERPTKLRGERARLVGLVLPELQNPIFPAFAEVVGVALAQQGFTPVLCTQTAGGVSEADYVELLLQQQVSGVVFAGGLYAQADAPARPLRAAAPSGTCRPSSSTPRSTASASRASRATTRWRSSRRWVTCCRSATRRIGLLAGSRATTCRRTASSRRPRRSRRAAGIPLRPRPDRRAPVLARGRPGRAATRLLEAGVTGIVCASDPMALGRDPGRAPAPARACPATSRSSATTTRSS